MQKKKDRIDHIILQHSKRGMDKLYALHGKALCEPAAEAFIACFRQWSKEKKRVFIYTGFYAGGYSETDGPLGAKFLYQAMERLALAPLIITDSSCAGYFAGMEEKVVTKENDNEVFFRELLLAEQPIAHFSIERLSANRNGQYCNCRGEDIAAFCPRLDLLFQMAMLPEFAGSDFPQTVTPTFAIGDGGNEIGMGNFAEPLEKHLHLPAAQTPCDYPILASVSNWGAYGFLAALRQKLGTEEYPELLPTFAEVEAFLRHIVACGATDGISGRNEMSIDGNDYHLDGEIIAALREASAPH